MGRTGAINAKVHATKSRRNFSLRTHPIQTMGPKTHVLMHFVMFGCIWDGFVTALNSMQTGQSGAINAKDRATNSRRIFSLRTHPMHTMGHKTWNSCLVAFRNVWVHLGSFRYCTILGAKWAELEQLMHKFVPRSRVGIFPYERTRYTPWNTKLMFCCIS